MRRKSLILRKRYHNHLILKDIFIWLKNDQFVTDLASKGFTVQFSQNIHKVIHRYCGKHFTKYRSFSYVLGNPALT